LTFKAWYLSGVTSSFEVAATAGHGCKDGSMAIPPEVDGSVSLVRRERSWADGAAHRWS
jgi:hypothetical protein